MCKQRFIYCLLCSSFISVVPKVPNSLVNDDEELLTPSESESGSGLDPCSGSRSGGLVFSVVNSTQLYFEQEAPNIVHLITHPLSGSTHDVAGTYTCMAVGEHFNASKELSIEVLGLSAR